MIVICTKCQAKFRVADDKIGPRGAKVRCSKCQTVFLVHPVLGTVSVTDGEARHVPARASPAEGRPAPTPAPGRAAAAPDPFVVREPFATPAGRPGALARSQDPFAASPPPPDPFAGADPFAAPAAQAGAGTASADPFTAAASPRPNLPVTDLSDLLGGPPARASAGGPPPLPASAQPPSPVPSLDDPFGAAAARAAPSAAPLDDPFAAMSAPASPSAPAPALEDPFALAAPPEAEAGGSPPEFPAAFGADDPFAGAGADPSGAPPQPDLELATPASPAPLDAGSLSLEDRFTPPPAPLANADPGSALDDTLETAAPADPFAALAAAPAGAAPEPFDPGAFDLSGGEPLGEPEEPLPPPEAAPPPPPPPPARATPARATPPPAAAATAALAPSAVRPAAPEPADRIPGARTSRLRAVAVNAVALFALLIVALALWAVWRTDGPIDAGSLRPSAILAALGRGSSPGAWTAQDVRSGVYDRARGAPLLFVRGRVVVSRAAAPVSGVNVAVQVVRGGRVLARGAALAGAVPTEEELYLATDDAAVAAVTSVARVRAPPAIRPGDVVPFLVALGDAPADLEGASLRIAVAPAGGAAP